MSEMRWVLLGGLAIVLAMLVAWSMQTETGPALRARAPSAVAPAGPGASTETPTPTAEVGKITGPARSVSGPVNLRATYGNPLAAQLPQGKMVKVETQKDEPAPAPEGK